MDFTINDKDRDVPIPGDGASFQKGALPQGSRKSFDMGLVLNNTSTVNVYTEEDFPTETDIGDGLGLGHHLVGGVKYIVPPTLALTYPIIAPPATDILYASVCGPSTSLIVYGGTGALFRGIITSPGLYICDMTLSGDGTNDIYDLRGQQVFSERITTTNFLNYGTIETSLFTVINRMGIAGAIQDGLVLSGVAGNQAIIVTDTAISSLATVPTTPRTLLTIEGESLSVIINVCNAIPTRVGDNGLYIDPASNIEFGSVAHSNFSNVNGGTPLQSGSLGHNNANWDFSRSRGLQDSKALGWMSIISTEAQVIGTADTPQLIVGTTLDGTNERFIHSDIDNSITYDGEDAFSGFIEVSIGCQGTQVQDKIIKYYIYKNGAPVSGQPTKQTWLTNADDRRNLTIINSIGLVKTDKIQVFIECVGSTTTVNLNDLAVRIQ